MLKKLQVHALRAILNELAEQTESPVEQQGSVDCFPAHPL